MSFFFVLSHIYEAYSASNIVLTMAAVKTVLGRLKVLPETKFGIHLIGNKNI